MGNFRYRDDHPHEEPAVTLDAFLEQPDATAVRLEAGEDANGFARDAFNGLAGILIPFTVIGTILMPWLVWAMASGSSNRLRRELSEGSDLLILADPSRSDMIRAPGPSVSASGRGK